MLFEQEHAVFVTKSKPMLVYFPAYRNELSMFSNFFISQMPFISCHLKKNKSSISFVEYFGTVHSRTVRNQRTNSF